MTRQYIVCGQEFFDPKIGGTTVEQVLGRIQHMQNPVVCFIKAGEPSWANQWVNQFDDFVAQLRNQRKDIIIHLTASVFHKDQEKRLREIFDSVIFVIADLVRPYYDLIEKPQCDLSQKWHSKSNHFLTLMGKPNKYHRIGLLYQLDLLGLLDRCVWSLHMIDPLIETCADILQNFGCENPTEWIREHIRNPDHADVIVVGSHGLHYNGVPFDTALYDFPKFQVVSETGYDETHPPWITEKVILAIANKNPFILASSPGSLALMRSLGFQTFENFCLHKDYDSDKGQYSRLLKIAENTEFWLENLETYEQNVQQDIDANFLTFLNLGKQYLDDAQITVNALDIDCAPSEILPIFDPIKEQDWKQWYNRIRDSQWPDCDREQDFCDLPNWIQKECVEVFGYKPGAKK